MQVRRLPTVLVLAGIALVAALPARALELSRGDPARQACAAVAAVPRPGPATAPPPLAGSVPAIGQRDIRRAWLASPTTRYGHAALGSNTHAGSLHALMRGTGDVVDLVLPQERVFEDRIPRLVDLDADGRDELVVVEAHATDGASLVVYGIEQDRGAARWVERARSAPVGAMRWLNPVGAADFDGDGRLEFASVSTPHVGGVLTLYRYAPPALVVLGRTGGVSNHRLGSPEQRLSALLHASGGPVTVVPDRHYARLLFHRWDGDRGWQPAAPALRLGAEPVRLLPDSNAVCVELGGDAWLRIASP